MIILPKENGPMRSTLNLIADPDPISRDVHRHSEKEDFKNFEDKGGIYEMKHKFRQLQKNHETDKVKG